MNIFVSIIIAVLCWIVMMMIGHVVYNHGINLTPGITIAIVLVFCFLFSTLT